MNIPLSTCILTLLLMVGLVFFIKASVKDRTEELELITTVDTQEVLPQLETYFKDRAYRLTAVDPTTNQVTFSGMVRPSWFMAIFLSGLALCGFFCLALVLSMVFPTIGYGFLFLMGLSPLTGWFYWRGANRSEDVRLQVETITATDKYQQTMIKVVGHRDELSNLQKKLQVLVQ